MRISNPGGYDAGYRASELFWPPAPGRLVRRAVEELVVDGSQDRRFTAIDLGCGEGFNCAYLWQHSIDVTGVDISPAAVARATHIWRDLPVSWQQADVREIELPSRAYDLVVAYGLLHCLDSEDEVLQALSAMKSATRSGGLLVVVALNDRFQELDGAHPNLQPTLMGHRDYLRAFAGWTVVESSDEDLTETHPDTQILHTHSLTRILARCP